MSILSRFRIDNQIAVITGGGRGIGAAIALAYAEAGADIVIAARTRSQLEQTATKIRALGRRALIVETDVMDEAALANLVDRAIEEFGRIDILVNNAGGSPPKPTLATTLEEFDHALRFNVSTAFALTRLAVPKMVATAGGGNIVNISSVAGRETSACFAAYGTAKAALSFLTRELAQDFAPKVRVNAIAVGSTQTEALNTVLTPAIEKTMVDLTPMARLGTVEDIAACALYLASPAASYVTGEVVGVTGGLNALNMKMPRAFD